MQNISIIGAGLSGSLLAIYLAKRGYAIDIYDARPDLRLQEMDRSRSINLALSCRGKTGLEAAGLLGEAQAFMVPMRARAIHAESGEIRFQSFGRSSDEYINAIERVDLNRLLLDHVEKYPKVHLHFNAPLVDWDIEGKILYFESKARGREAKNYQLLIGADGASSFVRERLQAAKLLKYSRKFLNYGYKELTICQNTNNFAREHLHLWPRDSFLLLGNPNCDGSITGSLFLAQEGKNSFASLQDEDSIRVFFKKVFPDAYPAMPQLLDEFLNHPTGSMSSIHCSPWYYEDNCLLLGDAAHGLVPFFGQGMNAAFEDCRVLNELLNTYQDDWKKTLPEFYKQRKPNTDAVAQMSLDNYREIQTDIGSKIFQFRKNLEMQLMHRYPERYVSKHVQVMFTNVPYARAFAEGEIQAQLLNKICAKCSKIEDLNWQEVDKLMLEYDKKLAEL